MSLWDPVYNLVKQIPRGRVITYGGLAKALRLPGGARSAGRAMGATPQGQGIPWHRVVGERGRILISGPHAMLQKKLLEGEGLSVVESRAQIAGHEWKPPSKRRSTPQKATPKTRGAKKTNPKKMRAKQTSKR
jgi:methylated-DNA-protein-cysteine methyltransferase related protein